MLPGDNLVKKVFNEGLSNADFIIIVLSKKSIAKPWVLEELYHAVIKRIENGTIIIPILIDDCEVPEALKPILWIKISDLLTYDEDYKKITAQIFGKSLKPKLGNVPKFATETIQTIDGLNNIDNAVLKIFGDNVLVNNQTHIDIGELFVDGNEFGLDLQTVLGSIEILEGEYLIKSLMSTNSRNCQLTIYGMEEYCIGYLPNYEELKEKFIGLIVNENIRNSDELSERIKSPRVLINSMLDYLEDRDLIELSGICSMNFRITKVTEKLKRQME